MLWYPNVLRVCPRAINQPQEGSTSSFKREWSPCMYKLLTRVSRVPSSSSRRTRYSSEEDGSPQECEEGETVQERVEGEREEGYGEEA